MIMTVIALNARKFFLKANQFQLLVQNMNFIKLQEYNYFSFCSNNCNLNGMKKESVTLTFKRENKRVNILFTIVKFLEETVKAL